MLHTFLKSTAFALALLTLAGLFAGCAAEQTPAQTTTEPTAATTPETEETPSTDGETTTDREEPSMPEEYEKLMSDLDAFPLTFQYDEKKYTGFAGFAEEKREEKELENGTETIVFLRHPDVSASFELVTRVFPKESAYEYVVYIRNDGSENTGIFKDLLFSVEYDGENPHLKGVKGDMGGKYYTPYDQDLTKKQYGDRSSSGRPTHDTFPYYNLHFEDGGTFIAIGWPGRWKSDFVYDKKTGVTRFTAGQMALETYIAPGETLRTPLMAFVTYKGLDEDEQTNAWRHYFINDVMRKIDGEPEKCRAGFSCGAVGKTTEQILYTTKTYLARGLKPELLWVDAGWYTGARGEAVYWPQTGTHNVDTRRFPDKMADIGKLTGENGMVFLLWFEVEIMRLDKSAFLHSQKDFNEDWLLPIKGTNDYLVNIGDPDCRAWVFGKITNVIDTAGVTGYRQDFNTDPANGWAAGDAKEENRKGMTENLYVQGYLALWDEIIARYPGIFMDSCASGGGRNDLESMKRAVPLHYSDWFDDDSRREDYDMKAKMTQALFAWFSYFKNEIYKVENNYQTRMNLAPLSLYKVPEPLAVDANWDLLSEAYAEHAQVKEYFYADYYPLTEWSTNKNRWNGWEFFDPDKDAGYALMFCHEATGDLTTTVKLKGLDKQKTYTVTDADGLVSVTAAGKDLMETGFTLTVPEKPYGALFYIEAAV